jgi:hypothetical protein
MRISGLKFMVFRFEAWGLYHARLARAALGRRQALELGIWVGTVLAQDALSVPGNGCLIDLRQ